MSGGSALTSRVSAALRAAGLQVLRYQNRIDRGGGSGIKVGNGPFRNSTAVSIVVWKSDLSDERDLEAEQKASDEALAVLIGRGFNASRGVGDTNIYVKATAAPTTVEEEDVRAIVEASGLDISQPGPSEWHIKVGTGRAAYTIRRTGKDARMRYVVDGRAAGEIARNIRSMTAAIDIIKHDLEKQ